MHFNRLSLRHVALEFLIATTGKMIVQLLKSRMPVYLLLLASSGSLSAEQKPLDMQGVTAF